MSCIVPSMPQTHRVNPDRLEFFWPLFIFCSEISWLNFECEKGQPLCMLHSLADCLTPLSLLEGFEKYVDSVIAGGLGNWRPHVDRAILFLCISLSGVVQEIFWDIRQWRRSRPLDALRRTPLRQTCLSKTTLSSSTSLFALAAWCFFFAHLLTTVLKFMTYQTPFVAYCSSQMSLL